jgi:hypothetical protein
VVAFDADPVRTALLEGDPEAEADSHAAEERLAVGSSAVAAKVSARDDCMDPRTCAAVEHELHEPCFVPPVAGMAADQAVAVVVSRELARRARSHHAL